MSGRRRKGLTPTLFPFLAVLVCTLGTLILLLALVAQNATQAAEQQTEAERVARTKSENTDPVPTRLTSTAVASMIDEERFRVEQLVAFRDQQTADLEDRRDQLTHLEDHIQRVEAQLRQLSDEVDRATGASPANAIDESAIVGIRRQLEQEKAALEQLREQKQTKKPRIVIVPHKGPNGTDRRPVYLECTARGVKIWPEGSEITMLQLEDSKQSANPLDAALRVIRHHAMQTYGDEVPPYPLIVVRPDGIESYAAVRLAMRDWDDQFGYELVPGGVELAFTKPDSTLKERVDLAIRQAIIQQHARHAIARRSNSQRRVPTLSVAEMDRAGRASGFKSHRDNGLSGSQYAGGYGSGTSYMSSSDYPGNGSGSEAARRLDRHLRAAAEDLDRTGSSISGGDLKLGSSAGDGQDLADTKSDSSGSTATTGTPPYGDNVGPAQTNPHVSNADSSLPGADSIGTRVGGEANQNEPESPSALNSTSPGNPSRQGQHASGDALTNAENSRPGGTSKAQAAAAASSGQPATADSQASQQGAPSPQVNMSAPKQNLVRRQGRDWALPDSVAQSHGNAIVRLIRVQCYPDQFVLLPSSGRGAMQKFGFSDGEVGSATIELATAVRDRVEKWGPSIPGGRWQPRLEVEVMPHADARFHQLRTLMNGSGVDVQRRAR